MSQPPADHAPAESRMEGLAYTLGFGARRRAEVSQQFQERYASVAAPPMVKVPLTTNQHILHLLLTVLTGGLWLPAWIFLAISGNRRPAPPQQPSWGYPPPGYQQQWPGPPPGYQQQWPGPPPGYQQQPPEAGQQRSQ